MKKLLIVFMFVFGTSTLGQNKTESKDVNEEIYGIDVSHHQGKIDWKKVKKWNNKKLDFVYIKATEGATFVDKKYVINFKEAKKSDLLVGSYHYFKTTSSVEDQFKNFIKTVDKNKQDLIPLIDVEEKTNWNDIEFNKNLTKFLRLVEDHFGKKPMIYCVNTFYNLHLYNKYRKYHFFIGRHGENPPIMKDNSNWTIWQFSKTGKIDGISKNVDIDIINSKYKLIDIKL